MTAFNAEIDMTLKDKQALLRTQWEAQAVTAPVGSFQLRYTLARMAGDLERLGGGATAPHGDHFGYGVVRWEVEPLAPVRGETVAAALQPGSLFRQVIDGADLGQTVVTFYVYPDSFAAYRQVRDYLYDRGAEVAGNILPAGHPIRFSTKGRVSRAQ
jgi:hypothetical protein